MIPIAEFEHIVANWEKLKALLSMFAAEYIDISGNEMQRKLVVEKDTMVNVYYSIEDLATKYTNDATHLVAEYYAKRAEVQNV